MRAAVFASTPTSSKHDASNCASAQTLLAWQRATTISARCARRGRIILLVADGVPIAHVAATVGISRRFVYKWVQRFLEKGLAGLADQPGRGYRRVLPQPTTAEHGRG
jgi:Helix-turn-helix domain